MPDLRWKKVEPGHYRAEVDGSGSYIAQVHRGAFRQVYWWTLTYLLPGPTPRRSVAIKDHLTGSPPYTLRRAKELAVRHREGVEKANG